MAGSRVEPRVRRFAALNTGAEAYRFFTMKELRERFRATSVTADPKRQRPLAVGTDSPF